MDYKHKYLKYKKKYLDLRADTSGHYMNGGSQSGGARLPNLPGDQSSAIYINNKRDPELNVNTNQILIDYQINVGRTTHTQKEGDRNHKHTNLFTSPNYPQFLFMTIKSYDNDGVIYNEEHYYRDFSSGHSVDLDPLIESWTRDEHIRLIDAFNDGITKTCEPTRHNAPYVPSAFESHGISPGGPPGVPPTMPTMPSQRMFPGGPPGVPPTIPTMPSQRMFPGGPPGVPPTMPSQRMFPGVPQYGEPPRVPQYGSPPRVSQYGGPPGVQPGMPPIVPSYGTLPEIPHHIAPPRVSDPCSAISDILQASCRIQHPLPDPGTVPQAPRPYSPSHDGPQGRLGGLLGMAPSVPQHNADSSAWGFNKH
jgi:hypothetical protein